MTIFFLFKLAKDMQLYHTYSDAYCLAKLLAVIFFLFNLYINLILRILFCMV